jgi:hypothetical protein
MAAPPCWFAFASICCLLAHSGFRVQGSGFRVQGSGFRVQGSGFRVQDPGFRVQGRVGRGRVVWGRIG